MCQGEWFKTTIPWVPKMGLGKTNNITALLLTAARHSACLLKSSIAPGRFCVLWSPSLTPCPDVHHCVTDQAGQLINFHRLKMYFGEVLDQWSLNPHIVSLSAAIPACGRLKLSATPRETLSLGLPWAGEKNGSGKSALDSLLGPPCLISGPK